MAPAAGPRGMQSRSVNPGRKREVVALLNVCVQEIDQVSALLDRLALISSRDRKEQAEMLTRILGKQAGGNAASSLWTAIRALSEAMHTHDQMVAGSKAETTIAMIELRAKIRHHFNRTFAYLGELSPNPDSDTDEDVPRRWCCLKW